MSLTLTPGPARGVTADSSSVSLAAGTTKTAEATAGGATAFAALLTIHATPALSLEEVPTEEVPTEEVPAEEVPAEEGPGEQVPTEEVPGERVPAEQTPVEQTPVEQDPQLPTPPVAPAASSTVPAPSAPIAVSTPALAAPAAATAAAVEPAAVAAVSPEPGSAQTKPVTEESAASAPGGAPRVTPVELEQPLAPVVVDPSDARVARAAPSAVTTDTEPATATPLIPMAAAPAPTTAAANLTPVAAPEPPAASTPATPLASQLAKPLFSLVGVAAGEHVMTITVSPDNLGPVTVRAHVGADGIRVEMFSPSEAAREALRLIMPDLRRDLAGAGPGGSGLAAQLELSSQSEPGDPWGERQGGRQPRTPADARRPGEAAEPLRPAANPWQTGAHSPRTNSASTIDVMA